MVLDKKSLRKKIMKMRLDMSEKQYHDLSHFIIDELKPIFFISSISLSINSLETLETPK